MKKLIWIVVVVIVIVLIIGAIINSKKGPSEVFTVEPIRIGAVLSLSGDAAVDGESIKQGMELAKNDLLKQGKNIEIVYQDDKTDAKDTVSAINAIYTQDIQALVGPTWSFLADAGVPVSDRLKLVTVMPANTSEYVSARSPYAFFATTKVEKISLPLSKWLMENNIKSVAMIGSKGSWYEAIERAVGDAIQKAGGKMVYLERIPYGSEADTLPTILTKLKAQKFDLMFAEIDDEKGISVLFKKFQELGMDTPIMSVTTSLGRVLRGQADVKVKNDLYVISPKLSEDFKKKFIDYYKKAPGAYADSAYDVVIMLVQAIENKGQESLAEYLRAKTNYDGYAGVYKFDQNGDIQGGEWMVVKNN